MDRYQPSSQQLDRLSNEGYDQFSRISLQRLQDIEASSIVDVANVAEGDKEDALNTIRAQAEVKLKQPIEQFLQGDSIQKVEEIIADTISVGLLLALLLAADGVQNLRQTPSARDLIIDTRDLIRAQHRATRKTADKIADGQMTPNEIRAQARRRSLGIKSGFSSASILTRMIKTFDNEGKRFITSAHPCPDCPQYERLNWVSIDEIVPVGTYCVCQSNCKCRVVTRFNPRRAAADLLSGNLVGRIERRREMMQAEEQAYLKRHGWA